jgi:uncharacterized membrane protein
MQTPTSIRKHPLHPMLVMLPVGLWVFSLAADVFHLAGGSFEVWSGVALYTMVGGFLGALIAAVPGTIDYLAMRRDRPVRRLAQLHMRINVVMTVLYGVNIWLRVSNPAELGVPVALSVLSVVMLFVSGWLGAEMVHVHGVGVEEEPATDFAGPERRKAGAYRGPRHA